MGGDLGPVSVFVSLHSTHHTAPVGRAPGPWSTWGHDTLPDTGPRDGWQVNQGNVVGEGQTSRAWSGGWGRGGLGLSVWACWKRQSRRNWLWDLERMITPGPVEGYFRQKEQQWVVQGLLFPMLRYCPF